MYPRWLDDERTQKLIKQRKTPAIEEVIEIAKDHGADDASALWHIFDTIRKKWFEKIEASPDELI